MVRLTIVLFIATLCCAQGTNPLAGDSQAAETGRWTFRVLCAPCHGIHAGGGRGPDLTRGVYSVGDKDVDLFNVISNGAPDSEMRPYQGLGDDNIWRIIAYLRSTVSSRTAGKISGNPAPGETLFW